MRALVLAGGFPQIDLIDKLHRRDIEVCLADYLENPIAKEYADKFFRISTLDVEAIRNLAVSQKVDFLITVCTDQALNTVAKVSEELGLPCYLDYDTAKNVTNKAYMKEVFVDNNIPTARYKIIEHLDEDSFENWVFPLIVKPVDCNSSKGVKLVDSMDELRKAVDYAMTISRTKKTIVEEYKEGIEISVDAYIEGGKAKILDITTSEKLKEREKFIIFRTWHPPHVKDSTSKRISDIVQQIADAFGIMDSPMLVQMIINGENVDVIEFSARTGGGVKHLSIQRRTGMDIVSAVIDLTMGMKPSVHLRKPESKFVIDEYIYCNNGVFDHLSGFEELLEDKIIIDYHAFKPAGVTFDGIESSGDRVAFFSVDGDTVEELRRKHKKANETIKAYSVDRTDMIRHDLLYELDAGAVLV